MDLAKTIISSNIPALTFLVVVLLLFYGTVREHLLPRVTGFKAFGIEATLAAASADLTQAAASAKTATGISEANTSIVIARAKLVERVISGAHVLWVDDHPERNNYERRVMTRFGIVCDIALSNDGAVALAGSGEYDVAISDMARDVRDGTEHATRDEQAGTRLIEALRGSRLGQFDYPKPPVIIYASEFDPGRKVPAYAAGMTNRPDELLHLVMDVLERRRWSAVVQNAGIPASGPPPGQLPATSARSSTGPS